MCASEQTRCTDGSRFRECPPGSLAGNPEMTELSLALMLLFAGVSPGEPWVCSIRTRPDSTVANLLARVHISYNDAAKAALASSRGPSEVIPPGDLTIEHACLVYTFNIRSADQTRPVHIDAGNGKLVSRQRNATPPSHPSRPSTKASAN